MIAGGRITGTSGPFEIGLLNIQTDEKAEAGAASTNFSVARVRRNILRRSNVGVIATLRQPAGGGSDQNAAYGLDANLRFHQNVEANGYVAGTSSEGLSGDDMSYLGRFGYTPDRYGVTVEHLKVGRTFNPEVGFVRRSDFRSTSLELRYSPRLTGHATIRQLFWEGRFTYVTNSAATVIENRDAQGTFRIDFHNGDGVSIGHTRQYEFLPDDFSIASGVVVPRGGYDFATTNASFTLGNQRRVQGVVSVTGGTLYGGTRLTDGYTGRVAFSSGLAVEPGVTLNRVELPFGDFSAHVFNLRVIVTPSARMVFSTLVQLNPSTD